tara:strand:- start:2728 stop:2964 length:237 start_codon:yes stop_codon:yes gene_type:complete
MDSKKRSFLKAITWKILGFLILPMIAILTMSDGDSGTLIIGAKSLILLSIIYHITMFMLFFVHERVWNGVEWGKKKQL